MDFENLNSALRSTIREMGLEKKIKERECLSVWEEVVGAKLASVSQAEDIRNGILYVSAKDPIWGQEIFNLKGLIIRKLNEKIGEEIVKDIKVRAKPLRKRKKEEENKEEERELSKEVLQKIEKLTANIKDEKMRSRMRSVLINYYKAKIDKEQEKP
jgi:predicted nucleic acid-binding Zn ribbon protein